MNEKRRKAERTRCRERYCASGKVNEVVDVVREGEARSRAALNFVRQRRANAGSGAGMVSRYERGRELNSCEVEPRNQ